MNKYSDYLGSALKESVEKLQARAEGAITLRDERMMLCHFVGESLEQYDYVCRTSENLPEAQKYRARISAASFVVDAIKEVRELALAEQKLTEPGRQVDIGVVHTMVAQLMGYFDQALSQGMTEPVELMEHLTERAKNELLTVDAVAKSRITVESLDAEVRELLATVPGPPNESVQPRELRVAQ